MITAQKIFFILSFLLIPMLIKPASYFMLTNKHDEALQNVASGINKASTLLNEIRDQIEPAAVSLNTTINKSRTELLSSVNDTRTQLLKTVDDLSQHVQTVEKKFSPEQIARQAKNFPIMGLGFAGGWYALWLFKSAVATIAQGLDDEVSWKQNLKNIPKKALFQLFASAILLTGSMLTITHSESLI